MAISRLKQVFDDSILKKKPKAEHGLARYAHVNEVVAEVNKVDAAIVSPLKLVTGAVLAGRNHADNAAALAAGLSVGDVYHTAGDLKVVLAA